MNRPLLDPGPSNLRWNRGLRFAFNLNNTAHLEPIHRSSCSDHHLLFYTPEFSYVTPRNLKGFRGFFAFKGQNLKTTLATFEYSTSLEHHRISIESGFSRFFGDFWHLSESVFHILNHNRNKHLEGATMARFTGGWVKIHRKAILGDIGSNYLRGGLFGALVAMANIQESVASWRGKPKKLVRGQIITSFTELASLGEVDRSTVQRHLNYLELRGTINLEKSNRGVLITLINFEKYQTHDAQGPHQPHIGTNNSTNNSPTHIEELKNLRIEEGSSAPEKFEARFTNDDWIKAIQEIDLYRELLTLIPNLKSRFRTPDEFKSWLDGATNGKFQTIDGVVAKKRWIVAAIKDESKQVSA